MVRISVTVEGGSRVTVAHRFGVAQALNQFSRTICFQRLSSETKLEVYSNDIITISGVFIIMKIIHESFH